MQQGGAFGASIATAQQSSASGVVIRERVELPAIPPRHAGAALAAGEGASAASQLQGDAIPPGHAVLRYRAAAGDPLWGGGNAVSHGGPISGSLSLVTSYPDPTDPGALVSRSHPADPAAGFRVRDIRGDDPTTQRFVHDYDHVDPLGNVVAEILLFPGEALDVAVLVASGETIVPQGAADGFSRGYSGFDAAVGCYPGAQPAAFAECLRTSPVTPATQVFRLTAEVEGQGTAPAARYSEPQRRVACADSLRIEPYVVREDGAEGWWNRKWPFSAYPRKAGDQGTFRVGDPAEGGAVGVRVNATVGEAQAALWYRAPACRGDEPAGGRRTGVVLRWANALELSRDVFVMPEGWAPEPPACKSGDECPEPPEPVDWGAVRVSLIDQADRSLVSLGPSGELQLGPVMVSKVRPDWLLPGAYEAGFDSPFGPTPFPNDLAEADPAQYFDPHTYRVQLENVPDAVATEEALANYVTRFEVVRGDSVVSTTTRLTGRGAGAEERKSSRLAFDAGGADAGNRVVRSKTYVRLVSNGRPRYGAMSARPNSRNGCDPWPPQVRRLDGTPYQVPGDGGACAYDDEFAGDGVEDEQTLLVRLGDVVRVSVTYEEEGEDPLGVGQVAAYGVGADPSLDRDDAIRRVDLVWHEYVDRAGRRYASLPDTMAVRASEDWAQAAVYVENVGAARPFRAGLASAADTTIQTIVEVHDTRTGPRTRGWIDVRVSAGTAVVVRADYGAGDDAHEIARKIKEAISTDMTFSSLPIQPKAFVGDTTGTFGYVAMNRSTATEMQVVGQSDTRLTVSARLEYLESGLFGNELASAAGWAIDDGDPQTADVLVVPRIAIQKADTSSQRIAYSLPGILPRLFLSEQAVQADDDQEPHTLAHELGHLLMPDPIPGSPGGPECGPGQGPSHSQMSYHMMLCVGIDEGERIGGPKRITPAQHRGMRELARNSASTTLLRRPPQ